VNLTKFTFYVSERSLIAKYLKPHKPIPGCKFCEGQRYVYECDSYIRCFITQTTYSSYHPVGTCRMADVHRHDCVVDPRLRVKGINRLRVCDASIMPLIPNGKHNAATIMIGEKCADLVKEDKPFTPGFTRIIFYYVFKLYLFFLKFIHIFNNKVFKQI